MKRLSKALVTIGATVLLAPTASAQAADPSPVVRLSGSAALTATQHGSATAPAVFRVHAAFSTDTPGAPPLTLQRAVIWFPDHAGTNGRLFPSCSARQIARFGGRIGRCPAGSQVGSGTVTARALQLGVTARGRVALFSSQHGGSIAFNIQTIHPAYVNATIDAPIVQLHGTYGEKLTIDVPPSLQQILPGVFVGVQDFDVTVTGAVRRHGVTYSFLKARTCPTHALHAVFDFEDSATGRTATATTDTKVRCRAAPRG